MRRDRRSAFPLRSSATRWFSCIGLLLVATAVTGQTVNRSTNLVDPQTPPNNVRYRLIYAPWDLIQQRAEGEYRTMHRDAFNSSTVALQQPRPLPLLQQAAIGKAVYTARLENRRLLVGNASWQIRSFTERATWLNLGPLNLPLSDIRWIAAEGGRLSTPKLGTVAQGDLLLRVDGPGTLQAHWTLAPDETERSEAASDELVFQLRLPQGSVNRIDLQLPSDMELTTRDGVARRIVLDRDPAAVESGPADVSEVDVWQIDLGGRQACEVRIRRRGAPRDRIGYRQVSRYTVSERGTELTSDFLFDCESRELSRLELQLSPALRITQVLHDGRPIAWLSNRQSTSPRVATIAFPQALTGLNQQVRVIATTASPPIGRVWLLPQVRATNVAWHQASATLQIVPPLEANDIQATNSVQVPIQNGSGTDATTLAFRYRGPAHDLKLQLARIKPEARLTSATHVETDANGLLATVRLSIYCESDDLFGTSFRLGENWNLESVESEVDGLMDRVIASPTAPRRLQLRFPGALPADQSVRVTIRARRAFTAAQKAWPIADLRPLVFSTDPRGLRHFLSLQTHPRLRISYPGADRMTWLQLDDLDATEASLLTEGFSGSLMLLDEATLSESVVFRNQPEEPADWVANIDVVTQWDGEQLAERLRIQLTRQSGPAESVRVVCSERRDLPLRWSLASAPQRELTATRHFTNEPGEVWELPWPDPSVERATFIGQRSWVADATESINLVRVAQASTQNGTVRFEHAPDLAPHLTATRLLMAVPPTPRPADEIGTITSVFRYAPLAGILAEESQPQIQLASPSPPRDGEPVAAQPEPVDEADDQISDNGEPADETTADDHDASPSPLTSAGSLLTVWNMKLETYLDPVGTARDHLTLWIENHGATHFQLRLPAGCQIRQITVSDEVVSQDSLDAGWIRIPLPPSRRFPIVRIQLDRQLDQLGIWKTVRFVEPEVRASAVIHRRWSVWTPSDYGIAELTRRPHERGRSAGRTTLDAFTLELWRAWIGDASQPVDPSDDAAAATARRRFGGPWPEPSASSHDVMPHQADWGSENPFTLAGWQLQTLSNTDRMFVFHRSTFRVMAYAVFLAAVAYNWFRSRASWRRGMILLTIMAVITLLTYAPFQQISACGFWGSVLGILLPRLLRQQASPNRSLLREASASGKLATDEKSSRFASSVRLFVGCALLVSPVGSVSGQPPVLRERPSTETRRPDRPVGANSSDDNRVASDRTNAAEFEVGSDATPRPSQATRGGPVYEVYVPIDATGDPTGKILYVPRKLLQVLQAHRPFSPGESPLWTLASASYRGVLEQSADQASLELVTITADFEIEVLGLDAPIQFPLTPEAAGVLRREALLNGRSIQLDWDPTSGSIVLPIRQTGRHDLQLSFRAITVVEAGRASVELPIPPAPEATVQLTSPLDLKRLDVPSARGAVVRREATGQLNADLGRTSHLRVEWPVTTDDEATPVIEQLTWLRLSRDEVRMDVQLYLDSRHLSEDTLVVQVDERLQLDYGSSDQPLSLGPAVQDGMRRIELDAFENTGRRKVIQLSFVVPGVSGIGSVKPPRFEIPAYSVRRQLAVSADPRLVLQVEPGNGIVVSASQFLSRWGGIQTPDYAYRFESEMRGWLCQGEWSVPPAEVDLELAYALDRQETRVVVLADVSNDQSTVFQQPVQVPESLQIRTVQLLSGETNQPLRWTRPAPDRVTIFFSEPVTGAYRLGIAATQEGQALGKRPLPKIRFPNAAVQRAEVDLFRAPGAILAGAFEQETAPELPPFIRTHLGPARWKQRWETADWNATWTVDVVENDLQLKAKIEDVVTRENGRWFHQVEIRLHAQQGILDQLTLELPDSWRAGLQSDGYRLTFAQSLNPEMIRVTLWPQAAAFAAEDSILIRGDFPNVREGPLTVPNIRMLNPAEIDRRLYLPSELDGQPILWRTSLQPIDETNGSTEVPPNYRAYRVDEMPFQVERFPTRNTSRQPQVLLADVYLTWQATGDYAGLAILDLQPDGSDRCRLRFPADCTPIWITVEDQPVPVATTTTATDSRGRQTPAHATTISLQLTSDQLPQRVAVAFRGTGARAEATFAAPALYSTANTGEPFPVQQTLWTIHNLGAARPLSVRPLDEDSFRLRSRPSRSSSRDLSQSARRIEQATGDQLRRERLAAAFARASEVSTEYSNDELRNWFALWAPRFERLRSRGSDELELRGANQSEASDRLADSISRVDDGSATGGRSTRRGEAANVMGAPNAEPGGAEEGEQNGATPRLAASAQIDAWIQQFDMQQMHSEVLSSWETKAVALATWHQTLPKDCETIVLAEAGPLDKVRLRRAEPLSARWGKALAAVLVVVVNYLVVLVAR